MELIETNIENSGSSTDFNTVLDHLHHYEKKPLDINTASEQEIAATGLFTNYQVRKIMQHRKDYGNFLEVNELKSLNVFREYELNLIIPYLTVIPHPVHETLWHKLGGGSHLVLFRTQRILESQLGYTADIGSSSRYEGSPWKIYSRYHYNSGYNFSAGFTLEKDAGETFFNGSNKNFDFASAHLLYRTEGFVKTVALGDYELRFGQGLIMWNGISFRKSAFVMNVMKSGSEIHQYSSVNEFNYLRGSAVQLGNKKVHGIVFYSSKRLDANVVEIDSVDSEILQVSSFQENGNHRTPSEIADESSINQKIVGGRVTINEHHFRLGFTATHSVLNTDFQKTPQPYNQYEFSGSELSNFGVDYKLGAGHVHLFGENAITSTGGFATINGIEYHPDPTLGLYGAYRSYARNYNSFYANAFGERSTNNNERGVYLAASFKPGKYWELWTYYDLYKHPWLKFEVDAPSSGKDYLAQLNYTPTRAVQMYWRFKNEVKQQNKVSNDTPSDYLIDVKQTKFRYHLNYKLNYYFSMKSRFEYTLFSQDGDASTGYMMYQDLQYSIPRTRLRLTGRLAYFDTESFDAAIYAYENDVLHSFSVPAYFYKGVRTYLILRVKPTKRVACWIRYARTVLSDQKTIGSGTEEISGNKRSEIKFQVAWTF